MGTPKLGAQRNAGTANRPTHGPADLMFALSSETGPSRKFKPTHPTLTRERHVHRGARLGFDRLAADHYADQYLATTGAGAAKLK